jgi:macrolide-specific efflux system membrane fusion protein
MRRALAALLLVSAPAFAAETGTVRRGDMVIRVKVTGTVVPKDVFRLKSTIDGRVETINASSFTWKGADQPLAMLAHKELAAIIDAKGTQDQDIMEDRWQKVYRPTPIRCPDTCFVLKVYARPHTWIKPQSVMFEAAASLAMVGRVRPEDAPLVRDGMELTFWAVNDPSKKMTGRVARFVLDIQGEKVDPGGTFTLYMGPDRYFDPGTEWAGEIIPSKKKDVLTVPTAALLRFGGAVYLPVRVSTGATTADLTQITSGVESKHEILILDDSQLHGVERHKQSVDRAALERLREELQGTAPADGSAAPPADASPAARQPDTIDDGNYGGEDPYGDQ